ncbi:MAG: outer membrane protein assembly factor BamB [Pseudohongiellaceae bacterium]
MRYSTILRLPLAAVVAISLGACSSLNPLNWFSGEPEANAPARLVSFDREVDLRRRWSVNVGNGQGDDYTRIIPTIDGPSIYAASANGNVVAVDVESGDVLWRNRLRLSLSGGVGAGTGLVLIGTEEAEVIALSQLDGSIRWRKRVTSEVLSAPQTDGSIVAVQTVDDKLAALDAETGEQLWTYEVNLPPLTLRGTSSPVITPNGLVIAGFSNGTVVAVEADSGVLRWEQRVAVPEGRYDIDRVIDVDGNLLLDGNRLFASSYQGNLMAFELNTGRIVWGREGSSYHGLELGFGNIYYCDDRSYVTAVRNNTETVVWENEELQYRGITAPTAINNYLAVADAEGYLHILSQIDGRIVGRERIDNDGVRAALLAHDGSLYAYGNSGRLVALSIR